MSLKPYVTAPVICAFILLLVGAGNVDRHILGDTNWPDPHRGMPENVLAFHEPSMFFENEYTGGMFFSKDGWKYVGNLFFFKLGPQLKWGITVSVSDPRGKYYLGKAEINPKKVEYSRDSVEVRFGESYVTGKNPNYRIHYVTDNVTVDISYKSRAPIWSPGVGDGTYRMGPNDKYFIQTALATPWADASGYFIVDGRKHTVEGQGYLDHGHYNFPFNRHMIAWEGFIAFTWEPLNGHMWNITVFDYVAHPELGGGRVASLLVIKDDKIINATPLFDLQPLDFRKEAKTGFEFPWKYTFRTRGGECSLQGLSIATETWEVLDILGELPDYIRPIVLKFLKRPVYWRGFGTFSGKLECGSETVNFNNIPSFHDANYIR